MYIDFFKKILVHWSNFVIKIDVTLLTLLFCGLKGTKLFNLMFEISYVNIKFNSGISLRNYRVKGLVNSLNCS